MSIIKDISELVKADVISQETADKIRNYYQNKKGQSGNRLFTAFGILGAVLVGLGIILIVAHNWDELSRITKTFLAFLPLLVGHAFCGFVLIKKQDNTPWRESGAAFLFFAVGASISLVSQIYNIHGDTGLFLLTWMLLCFPLIYLLKSSITSLLYISGITYYAVYTSYWSYPSSESYFYWILLLIALPYYFQLYKKQPESNFMIFHNWLIPLSIVITLGTVTKRTGELMFIAYFSLFGLFYLVGNLPFFKEQRRRNNSYLILGSLGTITLLLTLSFDWFWKDLINKNFQFNEVMVSPEFFAAVITSLLAGGLLYSQKKNNPIASIKPIAFVFILFIIIFIIGLYSSQLSIILINLIVLAIGVMTIRNGAKLNHLGILNYGLLIVTALVVCRFFDTDLSFITRGVLFMSVGIGFFITNYWMLKKRKINE